jgi:hypothetical protein
MVRDEPGQRGMRSGFPHTRGDGPDSLAAKFLLNEFSPHAWGWSGHRRLGSAGVLVFPTRVGMVRDIFTFLPIVCSFPHTRGDGPYPPPIKSNCSRFSPHAWGWSDCGYIHGWNHRVFPTRVGMVRHDRWRSDLPQCFPHTRGDGPKKKLDAANRHTFSPHAWGWSAVTMQRNDSIRVFPTRVGMVRVHPGRWRPGAGFPHTRGDGPQWSRAGIMYAQFSPHAWGWSAQIRHLHSNECVFPTRVGMVRAGFGTVNHCYGFPHTRGDGPEVLPDLPLPKMFSPHAWGWSAAHQRPPSPLQTLPRPSQILQPGHALTSNPFDRVRHRGLPGGQWRDGYRGKPKVKSGISRVTACWVSLLPRAGKTASRLPD